MPDADALDDQLVGVIYRHRAPTEEDYHDAIVALGAARTDLIWKREGRAIPCCFVCEDSGHTAEHCHHNPLLLARKWAAATAVWQCYHCGFTATNDAEARDHFGLSDEDKPKCLADAASPTT